MTLVCENRPEHCLLMQSLAPKTCKLAHIMDHPNLFKLIKLAERSWQRLFLGEITRFAYFSSKNFTETGKMGEKSYLKTRNVSIGHGCPCYCQIHIKREFSLTKGNNS